MNRLERVIAKSESDVSSLQVHIRERDNRVRQHESEIASLQKELQDAHNHMSSSDVETRRAVFELERIKTEFDAERQERSRIQRALETREKEIQAIQSKSAGEASSLFMDELHRLVRRLESELNLRTSAARDAMAALRQLKTFIPAENDAFKLACKSLAVATSLESSEDTLQDAGQPGISSGQNTAGITLDSVANYIQSLRLEDASLQITRLLTDKSTTPVAIMSRLYYAKELRSPEIVRHLGPLIMILKNLKDAQKVF